MTYRDRREARAARYDEWAGKREDKAEAAAASADQIAGLIPLGQPLLSDHYSYGRDRRTRDKMHRDTEKSYEHSKKAREMRSKADEIQRQLDRSIYSDDEDAIEKLEERVATLEAERARWKAYNASCRKGERDLTLLTENEQRALIDALKYSYSAKQDGSAPGYVLSNLSGNINRQKKRLEALKARS